MDAAAISTVCQGSPYPPDLSQYLIGPGFVPQRLPQQKAAGAKKSILIGSHLIPPPESIVGRYRYLDCPVPFGARKERKFYQALLIALNAEGPNIRLRKVAEMLVKQALKGEAWAIKELADRIDGKVPQAQIIQGDEDGGRVRYYAEMPVKDKTTEEWLRGNPVKAEPITH